MRLVFACVLGWFALAAAAALASHGVGSPPTGKGSDHKGRHDRSGSLIVALGSSEAR